jgi:hypothetical protein
MVGAINQSGGLVTIHHAKNKLRASTINKNERTKISFHLE